ncbi:MAG: ABC transporter ATP-binding protein [Candidatus Delongbacteria bacterium]|nr:MAG: ABC transporter ATP-binding protein [Candidatus Delongbacteria bacterium]
MIKIKNLTKKYGKTIANRDINLVIEQGKVTILLGPNGSGKTTLLKSICGLHTLTEGKITIGDFDSEDLRAKELLAYSPERSVLYDYLTLEEHLKFILKGYDREDNIKNIDPLIEKFGMSEMKKVLTKNMSNGQKQKTSIMMALIIDTPIIIFDEPFNGLDPESVEIFKEMLTSLAKKGKTIILSTHLLDLAKTIADEYKIIRNSTIVKECGNDPDILNIYLESGKD